MPEQSLLIRSNELIRPLDGRSQGPVPGICCGPAAAEQIERAIEAGMQISEREGGKPPSRKLDGQRHPVKPPNDVDNKSKILMISDEPGPDPLGAVEEQRYGRDALRRAGRAGQREWCQPGSTLGGKPQRFTACGQDGESGAAVEQNLGELS